MPDVGLTTATEPLDPSFQVVIKYSVEVEGLPVYQESYDAAKIAKELEADKETVHQLWLRRLECGEVSASAGILRLSHSMPG